MTNVYALLAQDVYWEAEKRPVLIDQMTPAHVHNLLAWLERRASKLHEGYIFRVLISASGDYGPRGDMACDAFDHGIEQLDRTAPETWLNEQPLVKKLRELQRAYREAEVKIAKSRNLTPTGATAALRRKRHHDRPGTWEGTLGGLM